MELLATGHGLTLAGTLAHHLIHTDLPHLKVEELDQIINTIIIESNQWDEPEDQFKRNTTHRDTTGQYAFIIENIDSYQYLYDLVLTEIEDLNQ